MKKCIYLIPHIGNFTKKDGKAIIGPSTHIDIGIKQLERYFEVFPLIIGSTRRNPNNGKSSARGHNNARNGYANNRLIGMLRDLKALVKNNISIFKTYRRIKRNSPDFIFERSEYLNFQGIICAKMLSIPHFYEANWVHYNGIQQFYSSHFNFVAKWLEERMYAWSSHIFFVGNQHLLLKLRKKNWSIIQNGVSEEVVKRFSGHENEVENNVVRVCILANLMTHHRMDIFLEALKKLNVTSHVKIYFIGVNFESIVSQVPEHIQYEYLGALSKDRLYDVLSSMNIAVISGGPFYSSFMKLYDYAAVKLAVICPDLSNLTSIFSDHEMLYFKNEDSEDLAKKMNYLIDRPEDIKRLGDSIYTKVSSEYTWENIFLDIKKTITKEMI